MKVPTPSDPILLLQNRVGLEWPAINKARKRSINTGKKIQEMLKGISSADASLVAFGSLARKEWTAGSDVDWTLLIDGQADPEHLLIAQDVAARFKKAKFDEPGATGIFGNMTFSHDLVQRIGGREDTNENTTRRILLLQESVSLGKPEAHLRVLRLIISRYLNEDWGFKYGSLPMKVPRFLLNDFVRYWRTLTVDFVEKQRGQGGHGWALRNAKLRMSRKLIFSTGMLTCFSCELLNPQARDEVVRRKATPAMEEHLLNFMRNAPLEILAIFLLELKIGKKTAARLFSSYDAFLTLLNNLEKRKHLKNLLPDDIRTDAVFNEVRTFAREFQKGLTALFFHDHEQLRKLTIFYGVF
jgi:hypothetical protein